MPNDFEGRSITLLGSVVEDENNPVEAEVVNNSLSFTIHDLELSVLGSEWQETPLDANTTFTFVNPQNEAQEIVGAVDIGDWQGERRPVQVVRGQQTRVGILRASAVAVARSERLREGADHQAPDWAELLVAGQDFTLERSWVVLWLRPITAPDAPSRPSASAAVLWPRAPAPS